MPKWIIIVVVVIAAYFAWRKWGENVKSTITSVTS